MPQLSNFVSRQPHGTECLSQPANSQQIPVLTHSTTGVAGSVPWCYLPAQRVAPRRNSSSQRETSPTAPHGVTTAISHPISGHLPEVGRKLELVAHVIDAPAKERRVHGHEDPFVARSLRTPHEGFGNLPVLVHVKLQPVKTAWSCFSHFFNGRGGPGAQHHPSPHRTAGWGNTKLYSRLPKPWRLL